jgi:hypothetical protein
MSLAKRVPVAEFAAAAEIVVFKVSFTSTPDIWKL